MKIINFFTNNWQIKLLAFVVAFSLWIYASSIQISTAQFPNEIPIKFVNLPPDFVAVSDFDTTKIKITTDKTTLSKLSTDSFTAFADLEGLTVGTHKVPVNVTTLASDVIIVSESPSEIQVTIEPSASKEIPVMAKISGDAATNMTVGDVVFDYENVVIVGPKSIIETISQATAKIVLTGEGKDFTKNILLIAEDQNGEKIKNIHFSPLSVNAKIQIVPAGNVKNLGVSIVTTGTVADGYFVSSVTSNPSIVSVVGTSESVQRLSSISTKAIKLDNLSETLTVDTDLVFPLGTRSNGVSSVSVKVIVSSQEITKTLSVPINTKNIPSGKVVKSISPTTVSVTVSGAAGVVNKLTSKDINLTLNLSSAISGDNNIQISAENFSMPNLITLVGFSPQIVSVTL